MSKAKIAIYFLLFVLLVSSFKYPFQSEVYLLFVIMLYIDAKDANMRVLLVLLTITSALFYELDYFLYFILETVWIPNLVIGDLILNAGIIFCFISYLLVLFYREEIYELFRPLFNLKPMLYVPTKADRVQIRLIQLGLLYHVGFSLFLIYIGWGYSDVLAFGTEAEKVARKDQFIHWSQLYVDIGINFELLRQFSLVIVVHDWAKQESIRA